MSNLLTFPKTTTNHVVTHIEATPDGLRLDNRIIGYSGVIRQLEAGQFDSSLANGLWVLAEIQLADTNNWFSPSDEQMAIIWRWLIACLFIHEQQDKNGTVDVTNEDGGTDRAVIYAGEHGGMSIYPITERCSLAIHIEGIALEKYGAVTGMERAIQLYQGMVELNPDTDALRLSQWGRESLTMLHDDFIKMLNAEGIPAAPTAH